MTDTTSPDSSSRWADLPTEQRNHESTALDQLTTDSVVELLVKADQEALAAVLAQKNALATGATWIAECLEQGQRIFFAGAGTSGRLGVLEAAECPPTFGSDPDQIQALIAGGESAVFRASEGAEDQRAEGARVTAEKVQKGDLLIGLSASSVTPFTLGALEAARAAEARTVFLTCAQPREQGTADLVIVLQTGAEVLTGSTRLKAGSATKAALNALTTAAMVRTGKVYENLMVDLRCGSAKLVDRARRIVASAAGVEPAKATELLEASGGDVKVAIVMSRRACAVAEARKQLDLQGGHVRAAISA